MKYSFLAVICLFVFSGCQGFRYHDPAKPHRGEKQFYNNYDNSPKASFWKWQWARLTTKNPPEVPFEPEIMKTDTGFLKENKNRNTFTWIGHASALLQIEGLNILIDPVFSERVSPVSFMGPKRHVALPFQVSDLPPIDAVVISHSHYDHLDLDTLKELHKRNGEATLFLVPLGIQELLASEGIKNVKELDWWEDITIKTLKLTFTPAQHWTQRGLFDRNQSLWGGWYLQAPSLKFLYTGDTGYSKDFQDIRAKLGPADVAMIPIGAYEPRWFMKQQHVNPEEALKIHQDLGAKTSIGVHWGTFRLADESLGAPAVDLKVALEKENVSSETFRVMKHGETIQLKD
ncbi:metal-dependent hydrolase [compost metagenome]